MAADSGSGLAGRVRRSTESDDFDLGGYTKDQCADFVKAAFTEPLKLASMVRLSFVVGGGKLCRQKYSDDLPKSLCNALNDIGFAEDKTAACELSSAGSYKFQHDTGKNLKFVHIFPRVAPPEADGEDEEGGEGAADAAAGPADVLATCEAAEFKRMVVAHVGGYATKRRLLDELKSRLAKLEAAEQKLISRQQLDQEEQALYDSLNAEGLKEKMQLLGGMLQAMVDQGDLTAEERSSVLEQLDGKLKALETELQRAIAEGKAKLQQRLEDQRAKLQQTKASVSAASPIQAPPLKHGAEIRKLRAKLAGLQRLEKEKQNFTIDELKRLGEKPELEEAIQYLEEQSRMWFESDEEFRERVQRCLKEGGPAIKKASSAQAPSDGFTVAGKNKRR